MKVKVLRAFLNTQTKEVYKVHTIADIGENFGRKLIELGFVEEIVDYTLEKKELLSKIEKMANEQKALQCKIETVQKEYDLKIADYEKQITELKAVIESTIIKDTKTSKSKPKE